MIQPGLSLESSEILACLECLIPAAVASASDSGTPNVTWLSVVHRLDESHVGLSRQFLRKTADNVAVNQRLQLLVLHPQTGHQYQRTWSTNVQKPKALVSNG